MKIREAHDEKNKQLLHMFQDCEKFMTVWYSLWDYIRFISNTPSCPKDNGEDRRVTIKHIFVAPVLQFYPRI
jgi:hypothetical protein